MLPLKVVPDGWVEAHRPVVEGFMVDTLRIERRDGTTIGPNAEEISVWRLVYEGRGLVELQDQRLPQQYQSAESPIIVAPYVGRVPNQVTDVQEHDRITVLASPDPRMVGEQFHVMSAEDQDFAVDRQMVLQRVRAQDRSWPAAP